MKRFFIIPSLIFCFLISSCSKPQKETSSQKFQFATPSEVGMIADSLVKIEKMVMDFVEAKKYPGAVTLIAKNGKIIYESEVGWSDSLRLEPYRKDHLFRMASMTKPIVSVAAMQLIESGRVKLDDPVGKYISTFNKTDILKSFNPADSSWTSSPSISTPTVRQLLTHTSGISYGFTNPKLYGAILAKNGIPDLNTFLPMTIEETMGKVGDIPLAFEPGSRWLYGLNTDVLGRVVEVASGKDLDDYIREKISEPLGIKMLDFYFNDSLSSRLTRAFMPTYKGEITQIPNVKQLFYIPNYPTEGAKSYYSGGGGMTGTARDYFLFCQAMLDNGTLHGTSILKPETAKSMHQNQIDALPFIRGLEFGFGFDVAKGHPRKPDGTYGWSGAFSTIFWIDPSNDLIVIQLRQVLSSPFNYDINSKLKKIVYSAFEETK